MTREEAIKICTREKDCVQSALDACADGGHYVSPDGIITAFDYVEAMSMAITALREQEERSKACPYCDIAKANEGVRNTVLWVKEPETKKWTMMGKKLLFCPMCGRRLEEV